jgi:hypothetical protein
MTFFVQIVVLTTCLSLISFISVCLFFFLLSLTWVMVCLFFLFLLDYLNHVLFFLSCPIFSLLIALVWSAEIFTLLLSAVGHYDTLFLHQKFVVLAFF